MNFNDEINVFYRHVSNLIVIKEMEKLQNITIYKF